MKVLLVDDSGVIRTIQRHCLAKAGINEICEASDGVKALEMFMDQKFDLVMTDWNMPEMDGLELLIEIRKVNQEIPVIMVTSESEKEMVVKAVQAGASEYIVKPFTPEMIQEKIEKWTSLTI